MRTVVITHEHLFGQGLSDFLYAKDFTMQTIVCTFDNASKTIYSIQPTVILLDTLSPGFDGLALIASIRKTAITARLIVLLSESESFNYIDQVLNTHVFALLNRQSSLAEIWSCMAGPPIRKVYVSQQIRESLASERTKNATTDLHLLTKREWEISKHVSAGLSSREIGDLVGLSPRTIDFHRCMIFKKLNVKNTISLVNLFARHNLS